MKETGKLNFTFNKKLSFIFSLTILLTLLSFSLTQTNTTQEAPTAEGIPENKTASNEQLEIEKKIEEKLKETLNKDEADEKVDVVKKYKNYNLTDEVERQYDQYQDDKDAEYFDNMDDLDKNDKYNKKQKKKNRDDLEEERYNKEWDEKVSKMHAHDLLTIRVNKKDFEVFYEEIEQVPVVITCAFYLHEEKGKMDFEVFNPKKKSIFRLKSKNRGFYEFEVREPGKYEFHLNNERYKRSQKVTFALHTTKEEMKGVSTDHLSNIQSDVERVNNGFREIHFNQKMLNRKFETHYDATNKHNKNITFWSMLETGLMSAILIIQLFYIKSLVEQAM